MRLAFPLDIRIGTDLIATNRILPTLNPNQRHLNRLTKRFLHPNELAELTRRFPEWTSIERQPEHERKHVATWLAGRWAAKEAAKKAWGATILSFSDLRVDLEPSGNPYMICDTRGYSDPSPSRVTEQVGQLSISHDGDYTMATVIVTPLHQDIITDLGRRKAEAESRVRTTGIYINHESHSMT
ncbi:hypothetical protein B0A52_07007 [Exophiala mesophila]|uniref:4'-phosphopantetheinyl transferase domain-containing protein n=1 Tax=Exophiala mesophila TaxID=212818 RepID=A0A438MXV0_EXOME|nr:hypothetical protein B0A52_07007 [Exophiala mesophila]